MSSANFASLLSSKARKYGGLAAFLNPIARKISAKHVLLLDYPVNSTQRWTDSNPHPYLYEIISSNRTIYSNLLESFLIYKENLLRIPSRHTSGATSSEPCWINGWMPGLDGVALYSLVALKKPNLFMEIGSGNSTKFARKAITDHCLGTKVISIDPQPRVEIDDLCDEVYRKPVENIDLDTFDRLGPGDILYVDNSHRVFMNSDATAIFLDVIPRLKPGVFVEIHDVYLPYDYPIGWINRYYSEQYLLAAYLLAKGKRFEILLPNMFISRDRELNQILAPLWNEASMKDVEPHGGSFWIQIN
jgi:hypothetical protein